MLTTSVVDRELYPTDGGIWLRLLPAGPILLVPSTTAMVDWNQSLQNFRDSPLKNRTDIQCGDLAEAMLHRVH